MIMTDDIDPTRRNKRARVLADTERDKLDEFIDNIHYSARQVQRFSKSRQHLTDCY